MTTPEILLRMHCIPKNFRNQNHFNLLQSCASRERHAKRVGRVRYKYTHEYIPAYTCMLYVSMHLGAYVHIHLYAHMSQLCSRLTSCIPQLATNLSMSDVIFEQANAASSKSIVTALATLEASLAPKSKEIN